MKRVLGKSLITCTCIVAVVFLCFATLFSEETNSVLAVSPAAGQLGAVEAYPDKGFLFVDGAYVPPPYKFEVRDYTAYINGLVVMHVVPIDLVEFEPEPEGDNGPEEGETPEEYKERKGIEEARKSIGNDVFLSLDLYTPQQVEARLAKILDKEKAKGHIPGYRISPEVHSIEFLDMDGALVFFVDYCQRTGQGRLGPPYEQKEFGTKSFDDAFNDFAAKVKKKYYEEDTIRKILTNYLKSQTTVRRFRFDGEAATVTGRNGKKARYELPNVTPEDARQERLAKFREGVVQHARFLEKWLDKGDFIVIAHEGQASFSSPASRAVDRARTLLDIMEDPKSTNGQKTERLSKEVGLEASVFAEGFLNNWKNGDLLTKRLKAIDDIRQAKQKDAPQ